MKPTPANDPVYLSRSNHPVSETELLDELRWAVDQFPRCPRCRGVGWLTIDHHRQLCTEGLKRVIYGQIVCLDPNYERLTKDGLPVETHRPRPSSLSEDGHEID